MQKPAFIFDGRNILDKEALENIGFTNVVNLGGIMDAAKTLDKKIVEYSE